MLRAAAIRVVLVAALCLAGAAHAQTQQAVEYFHAGWGHYFVTSFPGEIAALDGGAFGGAWTRTGQTFGVWSAQEANNAPVCRFFSTTFSPRSSHFYTPFASECDTLKQNKDWQFEAIAFHLRTPDAGGSCPAGAAPLYRLYNNGGSGAPNHRYTKSRAIVDQMRGQGWSPEGSGPDVTFACLPAEAGGGSGAAGVWTGTTSQNEPATVIILEDGTFYAPYADSSVGNPGAIFQGSASVANGAFASSDGMHFVLGRSTKQVAPASLTGSYVPGTSLLLDVADHRGTRTLSAAFVAQSNQPATLAAIAGTYLGSSGHAPGSIVVNFDVDANGKLTGSNAICAFEGTAVPRPGVAVFDLTIAGGGGCVFGRETLHGILYYNAALRELAGYAAFDKRRDLYFIRGTKR